MYKISTARRAALVKCSRLLWVARHTVWEPLSYTTYSTTNNKNQNDGAVVYLKDTVSDIIVTETNTQALTALEISFKMSKIDFLIYAIYRSPNTDVTLLELNDKIL